MTDLPKRDINGMAEAVIQMIYIVDVFDTMHKQLYSMSNKSLTTIKKSP